MKERKPLFIAILLACLIVSVRSEQLNAQERIPLVPAPQVMQQREGSFRFAPSTVIRVENSEQARQAEAFAALFTHAAGFTPKVTWKATGTGMRFLTDKTLASEAYKLHIAPTGIILKASSSKGFFYGLQTLRLLLPADIERNGISRSAAWKVPAADITDSPRFAYRGLMLDVARFFIPKDEVIRIIDCMAMLKLNKLHLHLVDDNGWRLEIKKYPRLTQVGAWRVDRGTTPFPARRNPKAQEPATQGGFYTQQDIRQIIRYASERQVEVIPEIEMPAHSNSALAAYPRLACPVVNRFIGVLPGLGGHNADIIYCAGNDSVYTFLQDVLDEVMALFPSHYIHLGGDEAWKTNWKKCPLCQARMHREHLADEEALQGYFMGRMAAYVRSKGREVMGWDELTNSKIPEDAIIYGWQGMGDAALKAAEQGHRFIMTPARVLYLIRYQGPQWFEPLTYFGNNTLKDVYNYEPVQKGWKPDYASLLMGVQASLWTEFCSSSKDVEYMIFPRLAALAETAWSNPEKKDWPRFLSAVDNYDSHLQTKGVIVARSMYNIQHKITPEQGRLSVALECIRPDVQIRYTLDGTEPTTSSTLYSKPLSVSDSLTLKSAVFMAAKQEGRTLVLPIRWNKATGKPVSSTGTTDAYMLTNGLRGSNKYTDFEWCCWAKSDSVSFTVDLGIVQSLRRVTLGNITNYGMAVHGPRVIRILLSDDGINFRMVAERNFTNEQIFREGTFMDRYALALPSASEARYVKVTALGAGPCPADHVRPGQEARIYFDEVEVE